jgi:hypothetical protein
VGFVVNKVALGQVFLQVLWVSPVSVVPPWLSILIYHLGDEQWACWRLQFTGSLTPIDMNMKKLLNLMIKSESSLLNRDIVWLRGVEL